MCTGIPAGRKPPIGRAEEVTVFPAHFKRMASYNRWANGRLYDAARGIPGDLYRKNVGAFFGSLHGTLNHLLVTDRIWMKRLTGEGEAPASLDAILFDDFDELAAAREAEDERILAWTGRLSPEDFESDFSYTNMAGDRFRDRLDLLLSHMFNHQTHHRGQAHTVIGQLGHEPPSMDLIYFSRQ